MDTNEPDGDGIRPSFRPKPTTLRDVDLAARVRAAGGENLGEVGEFFGWKPSKVTKGIEDFTREQLAAKGWMKDRLLDVAEAYDQIAEITPENPSAAGRATQLREMASLCDE